MKVLYIGNYRDNPGGWSNASYMWVRALHKAFPDSLSIRPFRYSNQSREVPKLFEKLESVRQDRYDCVIQNVLPPDMRRVQDTYNVGIFYTESAGVLNNGQNNWAAHVKSMDMNWVSSKRELAELDKIMARGEIIPQSIDIHGIQSTEPTGILPNNNTYRFYTIGVEGPRKNLYELLIAYLTAFTSDDDVQLVLKINNKKYFESVLNEVKKMVPGASASIQIIPETLTDSQMISLHKECDCYISASSEEAIGRPLMTACALGKPTIVTAKTSMCDIQGTDSFRSSYEPCLVYDPPVPGIYTSREYWYKPSIKGLADKMRTTLSSQKKESPYNISKYDFRSVASQISKSLKGGCDECN